MTRIHNIRTPISSDDIVDINVGDILYVSGIIVTARDAIHKKVVKEGIEPPIDLRGLALFHAGPIVRRIGNEWRIVSIGPTTSMRMEPYEAEFIERTGVKVIIGKGFMGEKTAKACMEHKCIVALFPGGCGALGAKAVKKIINVYWLDLGIPEAMWVLEVENLGPMIVTIDSKGRNLYNELRQVIEVGKRKVLEELAKWINTYY